MPRLLRTVARTAVVAGTATTVSNRVSRRQSNKWSQQEAAQAPPEAAPAAAAPVAAAPASSASTIDQLKELGDLKAQGVLTEDEFAAQKAKLLAG
ncbi:MAG TPA: SHOCT domain-containing protein [Solirubrobacterales bacterium]|nr:SHOCT domain-containing protein [Solirubrobacterales bacterium]